MPGGRRFERFTERAKQVLVLAQEEALSFNHNYIGTEHLLLGLLRVEEGIAARVLKAMQVQVDETRAAVEQVVGRGGQAVSGPISLTPRGKRVIQLAEEEARHMGHFHVGTEHLLLGMAVEGEGIAVGVLDRMGATAQRGAYSGPGDDRHAGGAGGRAGPGARATTSSPAAWTTPTWR